MEWNDEHDILFCREVIAFDLCVHKPGSKERGQCLDRIAESLNNIPQPYFKVDQRSLRDRLKKLLKQYVEKRNREEKASGVDIEHPELDDLLLDIHERVQQTEAEAVENKTKVDQERLDAEQTRLISMERLSETKKREALQTTDDSPPTKKARSSGGDTVAYLRDKTEKDFQLQAEENELRRQELELNRAREQASKLQITQILQNSQQQAHALTTLVRKLADNYRHKQNCFYSSMNLYSGLSQMYQR